MRVSKERKEKRMKGIIREMKTETKKQTCCLLHYCSFTHLITSRLVELSSGVSRFTVKIGLQKSKSLFSVSLIHLLLSSLFNVYFSRIISSLWLYCLTWVERIKEKRKYHFSSDSFFIFERDVPVTQEEKQIVHWGGTF